jgi:hypothetical protein
MPRYKSGVPELDVGDELTQYCRNNSINTCCFKNTYNDRGLIEKIGEKYRGLNVDRCVNENGNVVFMHLGRGIPMLCHTPGTIRKLNNSDIDGWVQKPNKPNLNDWVKFCRNIIE